jgi:hypothetical protein
MRRPAAGGSRLDDNEADDDRVAIGTRFWLAPGYIDMQKASTACP